MSLGGPDTLPQLFVVDSQAPYAHLPTTRRRRKPSTIQTLLLLLGVLALSGVLVEGVFIYYLYRKTQVGTTMSQIGDKDNLPMAMRAHPKTQQKPSAHLLGSTSLKEGIIHWSNINSTATFTSQMDYKDGHLMVPRRGFYYLYTKVYLDLSEGCTSFQVMKLMKNTVGYHKPIELLHSNRFSCPIDGRSTDKEIFLSGIFNLASKDEVYVTLENKAMKLFKNENYMGAFMLHE
ncbi:tumor necrosis factor ligand superfamily member 14-like isoform X2 [Gadus macrocephalus]|uniref:tumor necrosis factor ligand superfamily member 14-like isoform X2 n=1 Tax=Gadus macrocephalus TaxID=80720 RepID=UPI0028CB77DF|nr:tumor necrosis factor ligand superfamily member 14-like isoform X2 [Gadus macrocephalus]